MEMQGKLDEFSYQCGVMDAFCEVMAAGVKRLALSHPCDTPAQRDALLPAAQALARKYRIHLAAEDALLITDLFPAAANRGKYQILFFKDPATLRAYEALKAQKRELLDAGRYAGAAREGIARAFGRLLSYDDASIDAYLAANADRE